MSKAKKSIGVQQVLLHPSDETKSILEYLCEQSAKLYNTGVYFARQTFFKTNKLLTGKFDLAIDGSIAKSILAQSLPSTAMQQTLMSVTEAFKSFKELRSLYLKGELHFRPKPSNYLKGAKLFKVSYPNSGGQKPTIIDGDSLPKYGEKLIGWKASGKRVERGLYRSANGSIVNADLNGSANILPKVASNLSLDLGLLGRRCFTTVARVRQWKLPNSPLSAESQCL